MTTPSNRRPAPRRSSLAGQSPVAPPEPTEAAQPAAQPAAPEPEPEPEESPQRPQRTRKHRHKVSVYQDPADTDRVRGAILHTMTTEGWRTLSDFINHAVMTEVERLEAKYNGGKPFPPVGARELPQGRPMGE